MDCNEAFRVDIAYGTAIKMSTQLREKIPKRPSFVSLCYTLTMFNANNQIWQDTPIKVLKGQSHPNYGVGVSLPWRV